ncbi:MAG: hypothetical protein NTZ16_15060 [Verrucomicrobia bacterium]|nr:hypothetical protein [Verrucomicrobiota bacterium]
MKPKSAFCSSSSHPQRLVRLECWLSAMLLALQATTGWAANGTWTNTWGSQWTNTLCWSNGVVANGVDSIADFSAQNMATNYSITLNGDRTNGNLYIGDTTSPYFAWTLIPGTGGTLTLQVSSNQPNIIVSKGNGAFINVPLASTNGFVKDGTNTLTLNCVNTDLTSNILIKAGVLKFGSGSAGMLSSASSIIVTNGSQLILNGHTQTLAGIFSSTSANNRITGGSVTPSTLTVSNGIYSGVLGGTNANDDNLVLVKTGTNTLTLGGVNTLTNLVLINGGSLQLGAGTTGTLSLASSITVTNNAQLLYVANTPVTNSAPLALTGTGATATGGIGGIGALGLNGVGALYQNVSLAPVPWSCLLKAMDIMGNFSSTPIFTIPEAPHCARITITSWSPSV